MASEFKRDQNVWVRAWGKYTQGYAARVVEAGEDEFGEFVRLHNGEMLSPSLLTIIPD